ncbi:MAG: hypothetical protein HPY64_05505 [Anaerolineae bacterium]|nr:hypothetical protein [Anaerolineae bacterium]
MPSDNQSSPGRLSDQARIALAVIGFGVLMLLLALLGGGNAVPAALHIEATNAAQTVVAAAALSSPAPLGWEFHGLGRRKAAHDLIFFNGTLYVAADSGLLILSADGAYNPAPGFPAGAIPVRLWASDDNLRAGLADGQITNFDGQTWSAPVPVAFIFPPFVQLPEGFDSGRLAALEGTCEIRGLLAAADGVLWVACADSVIRLHGDDLRRYTGLDGLPGAPTGAIRQGPDGRLWFALENGVAALSLPVD